MLVSVYTDFTLSKYLNIFFNVFISAKLIFFNNCFKYTYGTSVILFILRLLISDKFNGSDTGETGSEVVIFNFLHLSKNSKLSPFLS